MRSFTTCMTTFCRTLSVVPSNRRPARMYVVFAAGVGVGVGLPGCWATAPAIKKKIKKKRLAMRSIPGLGSLCEGDSMGSRVFLDSRKHYHRSSQMARASLPFTKVEDKESSSDGDGSVLRRSHRA